MNTKKVEVEIAKYTPSSMKIRGKKPTLVVGTYPYHHMREYLPPPGFSLCLHSRHERT